VFPIHRYDHQTPLYYLNSRYYDKNIARFINADGLLGSLGDSQTTNMYAYCANNPVMYTDITGYLLDAAVLGGLISLNPIVFLAILAVLVTVVVVAVVIENQKYKTDVKNKSYEVYKLVDLQTNEVKYVGRTSNRSAREGWHKKTRPELTYMTIESGLDYETARGLEQNYIIFYETLKPGIQYYNQINGISPKNPNLEVYTARAFKFMIDRAENWLLNQAGK